MRFDIITIFPNIFDSYFGESILKRAQESGKIDITVHNIRDWATDKHKTTDDIPYGGGAGMVMKIEPIYRAVQALTEKGEWISENGEQETSDKMQTRTESGEQRAENTRIILFSAKGKQFTQSDAERLSKYDRLIMICGRYEGVDERVAEHIADEEISIGEYVLTGGEIPAMVVVDSIARLLPGVLGNEGSLLEESFSVSEKGGQGWISAFAGMTKRETDRIESKMGTMEREYPQYTRPEEFNGWKVPQVLLSGNHKKIQEWRRGRKT